MSFLTRLAPGPIVQESYDKVISLHETKSQLHDTLKKERGESVLEIGTAFNTFEKLGKHNFFTTGFSELFANIAWFEGEDEILKSPEYRRNTIFPHLFAETSGYAINETIKEQIFSIVEKAFGEEQHAQILLEKIIHTGPYRGKYVYIDNSISIFRDSKGNISAEELGKQFLARLEASLS